MPPNNLLAQARLEYRNSFIPQAGPLSLGRFTRIILTGNLFVL